MDFVLSFVMDLLINCFFMNTTKPSQDCLLPEQLVIGQAIPQDFLGILLDKLSEDNKTFFVNQEDLEGKQQEPETKQNDQPSGGMSDKKDLLSLLQALFLRNQENIDQTSTQNGSDEKEEDTGAYFAMADLLKIVKSDTKTGTESRIRLFGQADDRPDLITAKDDITAKDHPLDTLPDTIEGSVQMFQAALADKNQFLPVQDNVIVKEQHDTTHVDDIPVKPVFYKQEEDHPLKTFTYAAATEDKPLLIGEGGRETELNEDYRVLFQKRDVGVLNQKAPSGKVIIPDEPFLIARDDAGDDGNKTMLTVKRPAETITPGGVSEKVRAISGNDQEPTMVKSDANLFQRGDHFKTEMLHGKDGVKVSDKTVFGSIIADRVEQVVERYANKNSSIDMVVRLKIDGKETILVGLKDEGQKISVQIKTGSEGVMNFIQSQKDAITKNLEGKNIYATIMVDINDQRGFEKNDRNGRKEKNTRNEEEEEFSAYLNTMA